MQAATKHFHDDSIVFDYSFFIFFCLVLAPASSQAGVCATIIPVTLWALEMPRELLGAQ